MHTEAEAASGPGMEPGLQADQRLLDRAWLRIGAGLAVAAQTMVFSLAVSITPAAGAGYWVVHGGLMATAWAVLILLGRDLLGGAWAALRERRVSIDLLFLVTLAGALAGSMINSITAGGPVYYEVVAILVVIHTTGRMLGARSRVAALRAVDRTRERFDVATVRRSDGTRETCPVAVLRGGETVLVAPGGPVVVDGVVRAGRAWVQETAMTGEWAPVAKRPGDEVLAGSHAVDGALEITARGGRRRLDEVLGAVERARLAPSRLQEHADRLMRFFLPLVVGTSVATLWFWWGRVEWNGALFNAMAVLLVACPCAMGLATPIAVWGGLARMSRFGLVARTGDFIDTLARADVLCFDKTGTLSTEEPVVLTWEIAPAWRERESWLIRAVAAVECDLSHPYARALRTWIRVREQGGEDGPAALEATDLRVVPGLGVIGRVEGREVRVGAVGLHESLAVPLVTSRGVGVTVDGEWAATVTFGEQWRRGLAETWPELRDLGIAVEVLTGDPAPPTDLGVPTYGGLSPAAKVARVREHTAAGRTVVLVGDGVNDAAAMGEAAAGIALGGGSDLARGAATAVFAGQDLRFLPAAIRLARRVRRGVGRNFWFAFAYNVAGMALAAAGQLHPVVAALLMLSSSALVAVRALRSAGELGAG
jgi:heavy metal translocating P-type ATPase